MQDDIVLRGRAALFQSCLLALVAATWLAGCSTASPASPSYAHTLPVSAIAPRARSQTATASWYGPGFNGKRTASGEAFHETNLTAASRTLPMGSHVRVTNLANGRSVVVRINDRGPFVHGRSLDLSHAAAERIGMDREGIGKVRISRLEGSSGARIFAPGSSPDSESYADLDNAPSGATHRVWGEHPREWIGRVKMSLLQSQYRRRSSRHYHTKTVSDPIGTWLMSALPHP